MCVCVHACVALQHLNGNMHAGVHVLRHLCFCQSLERMAAETECSRVFWVEQTAAYLLSYLLCKGSRSLRASAEHLTCFSEGVFFLWGQLRVLLQTIFKHESRMQHTCACSFSSANVSNFNTLTNHSRVFVHKKWDAKQRIFRHDEIMFFHTGTYEFVYHAPR